MIEKGVGNIHTSRATFIGKAINNFPEKIAIIQDIVGHSKGSQSLTIDTYGKGFSIKNKFEIVKSIIYEDETILNEFSFDIKKDYGFED